MWSGTRECCSFYGVQSERHLDAGNRVVYEGKGSNPAFKGLKKYYTDRYFIREMVWLD